MGPMGHIGLIRHMSHIGLIGFVGLMGIMLSSCKHDEGLRPAGEPEEPLETVITFSGSEVEEAVTRVGTPLNESGVTEFKVWGYKNMDEDAGDYSGLQTVFPEYTVEWHSNSAATTTTNSSNWEYILPGKTQTIKFWDWSARAYRFFAATGTGTYEPNEPNGPYTVTVAADASPVRDGAGSAEDKIAANIAATPYISRLWFSTGQLPTYVDKQFGRPVQLEFLRPLSRVRFIFKYVHPREGIKLENKKFMPTADIGAAAEDSVKIARKGTVTVSYPLTGTATRESYSATPDADKSTRLAYLSVDYDPEDDSKDYTGTQTDNGWYMVLPNPTQGSFTLTVDINGTEKKAVVPAAFMHWLPGYSYTYIFKVLDEGGVEIDLVESAVIDWSTVDITHTVYNW